MRNVDAQSAVKKVTGLNYALKIKPAVVADLPSKSEIPLKIEKRFLLLEIEIFLKCQNMDHLETFYASFFHIDTG